jgi:glycosyltransferase involved in cell wall biosynthesis/putative flippase GtrA
MHRWLSFLKYCITGGLNTGLSYLVYAICIGIVRLSYPYALAVGYVTGMVSSLLINTFWTFGKTTLRSQYVWKFGVVNLLLLLLSEGSLHLLIQRFHLSAYLAQALNLIPFTLLGYVLNQCFVYTDPHENELSKSNETSNSRGVLIAMMDAQTPFRKKRISVVIPCYNEELVVQETYRRLTETMRQIPFEYELIFVNDGSKDRTAELLNEIANHDFCVKVIDFSRNFGHQIAVTAGIEHASGDAVVLIDADLQDPPELIHDFIQKWEEGYDVVYAIRQRREGESKFKLLTAAMFYRLMQKMTEIPIPLDTGDFRLMDRKVVDSLKQLQEHHRFIRGLVSWVGYKQIGIPYVRAERFAGETKYPLRKMIKFAIDGITSFSFKPLQMATKLGIYSSLLGFIGVLLILYLRLFTQQTIQGWTSLMVVILFMGGIQLFMLGIIGEYLGRIYDEVRDRPLYLVKSKTNFADSSAPSKSQVEINH